MSGTGDWGIFTLGNDAVFDWLLGFVESLRHYEPTIPLRLIPFDDRLDRTRELLRFYDADIYSPPTLEAWDRVGETFYPGQPFHARGFRKLAAFGGPFERFLYCDSDVAVLSPLGELCRAAERSAAELIHFDTDVEQVYRPGAFRDQLLSQGLATGFNCGIFGGRLGTLTLAQFEKLADEWALRWPEHLVANAEQPFVNLIADLERVRRVGQWELLDRHCSTCWAAVGEFREEPDAWRLRGTDRWDEGWRLLFAHWAGFRREGDLPNRHVFEHFHRAARRRIGSARPEPTEAGG